MQNHLTKRSLALTFSICVGASPLDAQVPVTPIDSTAPLGTRANPVKASGPSGQREYLQRLRCSDNSVPKVLGRGSSGGGDGHIIDAYTVQCDNSPAPMTIMMDMYHGPEREFRAVAPFTVQEHPARLAPGCPPSVVPDKDSSARYVFIWYEVETTARLLSKIPSSISGPKFGLMNVSFIIDTTGRVEAQSIKHSGVDDSTAVQTALGIARELQFTPAEHRPGCKVRQFSGASITVRP